MIPSNNIESKYQIIYNKLITLKSLLKQKIEECDVDWEACIEDQYNNVTQEDLDNNQISFDDLIRCLIHTNYKGTKKSFTDYNGHIPTYDTVGTIHEKDYYLIERINFYMDFLRWFLTEMNVSNVLINRAKTLKELILLLDYVPIYTDTEITIINLNEENKFEAFLNQKNVLEYELINLKTQESVNVPRHTINCTCNNNNIIIENYDVVTMNWRLTNDNSHRVSGGYYEIDFYLEADYNIPDEQFYNIARSYPLDAVIRREDKNKIHIYYPELAHIDDSMAIIIQVPQKIVNHKFYDMVRVTYQSAEYELTYPNGQHETGIFIKPQNIDSSLLPTEINCNISFSGYEQYKPTNTDFTIIVKEAPYIMTSTITNINYGTKYYLSEEEGYISDKWRIEANLINNQGEPVIGERIYLKIEGNNLLEEPLITDNNGDVTYIGTIPYVNANFIDYTDYHIPNAIQMFIENGEIDLNQSLKLYYKEETPAFFINTNNQIEVINITDSTKKYQIIIDGEKVGFLDLNHPISEEFSLTSDSTINIYRDDLHIETLSYPNGKIFDSYNITETESLIEDEIQFENNIYYYYIDEDHKYEIILDGTRTTVTNEICEVKQIDDYKDTLDLTIYTDTNSPRDTQNVKKVKIYYEPFIVRLDATNPYTDEVISDIYAGADTTLTLTFCDPLTQEPLQENIHYTNCLIYNNWDNSSVSSNIDEDPIIFEDYTVSNTPTSSAQLTIDIYTDQNNYERFFYNFEIKNHLVFPNKNTYLEGDIPEIFYKPFGEVIQENDLNLILVYHDQAYRLIYPTGINLNTGLIDLSQFRHVSAPYNFDTSQFSIGEHTLDFRINSGYFNSQEVYTFNVIERPVPTSLYLASNKSHIDAFNRETCNVYATVLDQNNDPISDIPVTISLINESNPPTLYTDENGIATRTYTSKGDGDLQFSAEITSDPSNFIPNTLVSEVCMVEDYYEIKKDTTMKLKTISSYNGTVSITNYNFVKNDSTNDNDVSFGFQTSKNNTLSQGNNNVYDIKLMSYSDSYYYGKGILTITYRHYKLVSGGGSEAITEEASFYVNVINPDNYDGLTLSSDKAILSYYDDENTILTAQLMNGINPVNQNNIAVKFYNGDTLLNTTYTNSNGIATTTYNSTGEGDVTITAKIDYHPPSDFVIMEDCLYYDSGQNEKINNYSTLNANYLTHNNNYYTLNRTLGESPASTYYTSVYLNNFTLPNTYEISVDISTDLVSQEMLSIASSPLQTYQGTNEFGIISTANQYGLYNRTNGTFIPYTTSGKLNINTFYNFNIMVDQTKIQTRIIDIDGGYVQYEKSSTINQATNFHKFAIVNGGKAHNIKFKNLKVKKVKVITLSTNKTILSYDDVDDAILTATHSEGAGQTITLYDASNDSIIDTMIDNQDGTYSYTYDSQGIGNTIIYAKSENIYSNLITIEDCLKYYPNTYNTTVNTDYTLPTNYQIEFTIFSNNTTSSSNTAFLRFDTSTGGYVGKGSSANRQIGIGTTYLSSTVPISTDTTYTFRKENNTLELTNGTDYITTSTTTYYTKLYYIQGSTNGQIKNIKIKPL